jgi:3-methyladenine DNA glycosylase Tag
VGQGQHEVRDDGGGEDNREHQESHACRYSIRAHDVTVSKSRRPFRYRSKLMRAFDKIEAMARKHHGGPKGVRAALDEWKYDTDLAGRKDARFLSAMAKAVFSSGFSWSVIEKKWPGFETAFDKFEPKKVAAYGEDKLDALLKDTRIVRNGAKIMATIENARFIVATAKSHGSFGRFLANWPETDQIGLMEHLKKNASRMGALRGVGRFHLEQ